MFTVTFIRPMFSLTRVFRFRKSKKAHARGPLPTWIDDPQLSQQLLKDTGLTPEDLRGRPAYDEKLPFFMQRSLL